MVACNSGASGGMLGATAMSLGKGYWEHHLGTLGIPWENCGLDGMVVVGGKGCAKQPNDFSFHFTPWAMSDDWDRFWKAVYVVLEPARATVMSINTSCFTSNSATNIPLGLVEGVLFIFGFEEWKMDGGAEAVLLLVCGLPGAGKTTLARSAEREAATDSWRLQRLSFDELFRACADAKANEFDPVAWKRCQREMAKRVRMWRASQAHVQSSSGNRKRLALLVDDNFQYRSLRKRFAHLATEVDCGFGILHANTPLEICRSRNAARIGVERVPDTVFERMANAFEAPDSKQHLFERNTITLSLKDTQDAAVVSAKIAELMRNAMQILQEKRELAVLNDKETLQRTQDLMRTHRDVVHRVDLQLRKWISSVLQQQQEQQQDDAFPPNAKKAKTELAQRLNQTRKAFLAQLKPLIRGDETSGDTASSEDVDAVVAVHVQCFKDQHQPL